MYFQNICPEVLSRSATHKHIWPHMCIATLLDNPASVWLQQRCYFACCVCPAPCRYLPTYMFEASVAIRARVNCLFEMAMRYQDFTCWVALLAFTCCKTTEGSLGHQQRACGDKTLWQWETDIHKLASHIVVPCATMKHQAAIFEAMAHAQAASQLHGQPAEIAVAELERCDQVKRH